MRVYHEDADLGGIVYYANYLKYMERARSEWLRALGVEQDRLLGEHGLLFAVARVAVDYLSPARFNDRLLVGVNIVRCGRASIHFEQDVHRQSGRPDLTHRSAGECLCRGRVKIACLEAGSLRPRPIPRFILAELEP